MFIRCNVSSQYICDVSEHSDNSEVKYYTLNTKYFIHFFLFLIQSKHYRLSHELITFYELHNKTDKMKNASPSSIKKKKKTPRIAYLFLESRHVGDMMIISRRITGKLTGESEGETL